MISTETEDDIVESEDTNNSGSHIDDTLNHPDEQGRVLVNIGHPADEPDIFLAPQIAKYIKRHQVREKSIKGSWGVWVVFYIESSLFMLYFVSLMRFICLHLIKAGDAALSFRGKYLGINNMILIIFHSDFFFIW